jgi:hypothetical protein
VQILNSVTFVYVTQQDRILAAINAGSPQAWSCWLTRRVVLALLQQSADILATTSALAKRVPIESRGDIVAFEHQAAMEETAQKLTRIPADAVQASAAAAELVERVSITHQGENFRIEWRGLRGGGAIGVFRRVGFQRILQILKDEVSKAEWIASPDGPEPRHFKLPGQKH